MILISHRGNLNGRIINEENNPDYILNALNKGFDVEVDVRYYNNNFYLGHDKPEYLVNPEFLKNKSIWCHAKDPISMKKLQELKSIFFWHKNDDYTLTSNGYFWTNIGVKLLSNSICVLPELSNYKKILAAGICSDFIEKYRNLK